MSNNRKGDKRMNLMPMIAKELGVEIGEKFKIHWIGCSDERENTVFRFTKNRFEYRVESDTVCTEWNESIAYTDLVTGIAKVIKIPFEPKNGEYYWVVTWGHNQHIEVCMAMWMSDGIDYRHLYCGNCFRTEEEAEREKYNIYERLTGRKWEEKCDS